MRSLTALSPLLSVIGFVHVVVRRGRRTFLFGRTVLGVRHRWRWPPVFRLPGLVAVHYASLVELRVHMACRSSSTEVQRCCPIL